MNEMVHNTRIHNARNSTGFILVLFGLIGIMVMFTEAMIIPALPTLQHEFNTTAAWASWIVSIYLLVSAVAIPIFAKLGDSYGKKKFLLVCMTFYTIGVTANGFAWNLPSLIVFRAFQGMGLAMFPLAFAIIRDEFPPERVPTATGIVSAMFGTGAAIGLVVGAWIANNYGWRTTYHTVIPIAIALTFLAAYKLKESPIRTPSRPDVFGASTLSIALVSFLIAMTEGSTWGWASPSVLSLFGFALAFIMLFLIIESRVTDPMIHLDMLSKRNVFFTNITAFIVGLANFLIFQTVIYLLQAPAPLGCSCSIFQAGLVMAPGALLMLASAPIAGVIVARRGAKQPLFIGAVIVTASFSYFYVFHATQLQMLLGVMFSFIGMSFMGVAMINIIIQSVEQSQTGIATAMNTTFRTVGGVVGPTIAGVFLTQYTTLIPKPTPHGLMITPVPSETAFNYIFLTALGISIIGIFVILLIKGRSDELHVEEEEHIKRTGLEAMRPGTQLPKQQPGIDATPYRVLARPAIAAPDVNNFPSIPREKLVDQSPSPSPAKVHRYGIEFMVRGGEKAHDANDVTLITNNGHITRLKAERSGEGDDQVREITYTARDSNGGEMRGAVAVRSADGEHSIRFTPDNLRDCSIELVMKSGLTMHSADAVTMTAVNADITQLKAERSGEGDDQVREITVTTRDSNGGEMRGAVAVRSAATKKYALNISVIYRNFGP